MLPLPDESIEGQDGPPLYHGPAVWRGRDMARRTDWVVHVSEAEVAEIESAVAAALARTDDLIELGRHDFPLPRLAGRLRAIENEVVRGRGFALLRGLPVVRWTRRQSAVAFWGLGRHFGDPVPQNAQGHLLGHVKDVGKDPHNPEHRVYQTSYRHLFHTDSCDIVGLLCLQRAKSGGLSRIVSSTTLFNEVARRRPDLARVLAAPFTVDRKGEVPAGKGPHYDLAIAHHHAGQLTVIYARDFIEAAQRFADVPRLSAAQIEAMDLLDALAEDPDLYLDMAFEPGDIQFLHNHQILHARTAYEDHPEPERRRHLLRLWLSAPNGRELPPAFAERYGEIRRGRRRGGIVVPGQTLSAPLEAE
jgi:Taurine catabolism dioxygenase TauD, TfdA family